MDVNVKTMCATVLSAHPLQVCVAIADVMVLKSNRSPETVSPSIT